MADLSCVAAGMARLVSLSAVAFIVFTLLVCTNAAPSRLTQPASNSVNPGMFKFAYSLNTTADAGSVWLVFTETGGNVDKESPHKAQLNSSYESAGAHWLLLNGGNLAMSAGVVKVNDSGTFHSLIGKQYRVDVRYKKAGKLYVLSNWNVKFGELSFSIASYHVSSNSRHLSLKLCSSLVIM